MLGLVGAHRTGKTTLARVYSNESGLPFVETTTSRVFEELGLDPKLDYDFDTRLTIQNKILDAAEALWADAGARFVSDRTPIDMLAYTLADVQRANLTEIQVQRMLAYRGRCIQSTNRFFAVLFVVQPGIPLVDAEGKAPINEAYIEHFNALAQGLVLDDAVKCKRYTLRRTTTNLSERVNHLHNTMVAATRAHMEKHAGQVVH